MSIGKKITLKSFQKMKFLKNMAAKTWLTCTFGQL